MHKISIRIKSDLDTVIMVDILLGAISLGSWMKNIKGPKPKANKRETQILRVSQTTQTTRAIAKAIDININIAPTTQTSTATEPSSKPSPQSLQEERAHDTFVSNLYDHSRNLIEMLTGYTEDKILSSKDNLKLVSDTTQYRFLLVTKLSELDAKTIYSDQRTLALLLNDFLKQLDDNLDARKKKEALTSE